MINVVNISKIRLERKSLEKKGILDGLEGTEQETMPHVFRTNDYLKEELCIDHKDITAAALGYGKGVLKVAARIAYDRAQRRGLDNNQVREEFLYLLEAVHLLGEKPARDLFIRRGKNPIDLLTNFNISEIGGIKIITPNVPLEKIASNTTILAHYAGGSIYRTDPNTVMFEYATR